MFRCRLLCISKNGNDTLGNALYSGQGRSQAIELFDRKPCGKARQVDDVLESEMVLRVKDALMKAWIHASQQGMIGRTFHINLDQDFRVHALYQTVFNIFQNSLL